jgi:hypothetical protein
MGDRKLTAEAPNVPKVNPPKLEGKAKEFYGELDTFFNMPAYDNPIGIEIELEDYAPPERKPLYWYREQDGSLKREGMEWISYPLVRTNIDYALHEAEIFSKGCSFGHRTSVHVHCNVGHYTSNQLAALVAFYSMLEGCFYELVDPARSGNTFCYPILGTKPALQWFRGMDLEVQNTTKYCALNIAPVKTQLSVEFRHMHGTGDAKTLRRWVQLCAKLVYYCGNIPPKAAIPFAKQVIADRTFETKVVPEIWGDTVQIFNSGTIKRSVDAGELWAMTLLVGEQ